MSDDAYAVLGVPRDAPQQQIVDAYRALVQIYHPDRYADAPARVREEALRRMQAVNAAYDRLRRETPAAATAGGTSPPPPTARRGRANDQRRAPREDGLHAVLYVDGSRHYHDARVAPLGLDLRANPVSTAAAAPRCPALDEELGRWFATQSRNASMTDKLMFAAWDEQHRALYTASVGCSEVLASSMSGFATPCDDCRPPAP